MKAEDLEIENTYIVEKIDLIGSQLCEVRIIKKLKLTMQIEIDENVIKWIQYEEFDKNWRVIEHYRDKLIEEIKEAKELLNTARLGLEPRIITILKTSMIIFVSSILGFLFFAIIFK